MYKVKVSKDPEREIDFSENEFKINGIGGTWDKVVVGNNRWHIIKDHSSYLCEIVAADRISKTLIIKVNGTNYNVELKDRYDELLKMMGMEGATIKKVNNIKAPMPGLVLKLIVTEGEEIKKGDSVLILEAMKMENIIKAPGDGKIKSIKVKVKEAVEKNQVLLELY
ncbi:MAG: acetyl-CoA carboxylase biotin carboxyl carrier protein subunit [Chitinophagales bacterium]|jgi:acetyl/propionyl-CoA carboxylase alpha subunit|nr:acetyl-CoA carboxylase biotin carboxyl carrier protein subunit [Chitinophagales bacterium]